MDPIYQHESIQKHLDQQDVLMEKGRHKSHNCLARARTSHMNDLFAIKFGEFLHIKSKRDLDG